MALTQRVNSQAPHGGKYQQIAAEEAKAQHVRPQDADKPQLSQLAKGSRCSYNTHNHAGICIVGEPMGETQR